MQVYEDDDRSVRKAGVDNLVHLYVRVGDQIWLFINGLSDAKVSVSLLSLDFFSRSIRIIAIHVSVLKRDMK